MAKSKRRKSNASAREARAKRARAARRERHAVQEERELDRRVEQLVGAETPPEVAAAAWLEKLEGTPLPARATRMFELGGSNAQARAVAAAMESQAPGSLPALTLAADVALQLDGDARRASALIDQALESSADAEARRILAIHLLELRRLAESLAITSEWLLEAPADEAAQEMRAAALVLARRRLTGESEAPGECPCWSGRPWTECCRPGEEEALARFEDRGGLEHLRGEVRRFTASAPGVEALIAVHVEEWLASAEPFAEGAGSREDLIEIATESGWLVAGEHEDDDEDAPLALFAASRAGAAEAKAAGRWLDHCHYGLWQVADPTPAPGVWLTELVTGTRRYAAIPPAQLEGMGRWTVLLGALVAIDATWRPAAPLIPLRPREADEITETAEDMLGRIAAAVRGKEPPEIPPGRWLEEPAGVLASQADPVPPDVAVFAGQVICSGMPHLLSCVGELRERAPELRNTDKDPICLVNATVRVGDPDAVAARLAEHPDFDLDGEGALTWWGREMDALERASGEAEVRALLREHGEEPDTATTDAPRRWVRGQVKPLADALEVDVNSRERLERFLRLLRELGEQPEMGRQRVIDPAQDMPQFRAGDLLGMGGSEESQEAWLTHVPDQSLPALGGRTPREAARRPDDGPRLEALLRDFEHDADRARARGGPVPDIERLREELGTPASAWL